MVEYELDKDGNKTIVKSIDVSQRSFVRFLNCTRRPVEIYWIDYSGNPENYKILLPYQFIDVNTFTTHPWIFLDAVTKERFVINNQTVFRGQASTPQQFPGHGSANYIGRKQWKITSPLRSLKTVCLMVLAELINDDTKLCGLNLPRSLIEELRRMISLYNCKLFT